MSATALAEDASAEAVPVEAVPVEAVRPEFGDGRLVALGAAVVVGVPAMVELGRFVTTIVLSLILGH